MPLEGNMGRIHKPWQVTWLIEKKQDFNIEQLCQFE